MDQTISLHAGKRMLQRGVSPSFLDKLLENSDVERSAGGNCRLYRCTRARARNLGDDRLAHFAVIWSDDTGSVVTVLPIASGRAGSRYRRLH